MAQSHSLMVEVRYLEWEEYATFLRSLPVHKAQVQQVLEIREIILRLN